MIHPECVIDAQHRQPLAAHWGSGTTSSSDAQFFHAGARGEVGGLVNLHYGQDPGVKFYTHLSDQFGPFHTKVIAATANEAPYVLDGLLYHQSSLVINEHYTTGGFSAHSRPEGKATLCIARHDRAARARFVSGGRHQSARH